MTTLDSTTEQQEQAPVINIATNQPDMFFTHGVYYALNLYANALTSVDFPDSSNSTINHESCHDILHYLEQDEVSRPLVQHAAQIALWLDMPIASKVPHVAPYSAWLSGYLCASERCHSTFIMLIRAIHAHDLEMYEHQGNQRFLAKRPFHDYWKRIECPPSVDCVDEKAIRWMVDEQKRLAVIDARYPTLDSYAPQKPKVNSINNDLDPLSILQE